MSDPLHVLFVCTANICRSPFMELLSDHLADGALRVSSAGTHGSDGRPMEADMAALLLARGVPAGRTEEFRSRRLTPGLVAGADLVVTAEAAHRELILDDDPVAVRKVFTLGQLVAGVGDAEGATGADLVRTLGEHRPRAAPALDVTDPYRRGSEAARACAEQVEALLAVAVPALTGSGRITP